MSGKCRASSANIHGRLYGSSRARKTTVGRSLLTIARGSMPDGVRKEGHMFRLQAVGAFETGRKVKCRRCEQERTSEPARFAVDARHRSAVEREQALRQLARLIVEFERFLSCGRLRASADREPR